MIVVLDMQDRRPAWAMPSWVPERLREALAEGAAGAGADAAPERSRGRATGAAGEVGGAGEVRVVDVPADGSGDGAARAHPEVLAAVEDADVYLGYGVPAEVLRRGRRLRWVHSGAAGVGGSLTPGMMESDVVFTNSAGVHAPPMAETAVGMILHFFRGLDFAVRNQARRRWDKDPFYAGDTPVRELSRATVGIVGFGGIGREVARRCLALGAAVVALRRRGPAEEVVGMESVGGAGRVGDVTVWTGPGALERVASVADVLVVAVPETDETRGMIDADVLAALPAGAVLLNLARGPVVDEDAVVEALRSGGLRGAGLDVFADEPLPVESPLWEAPGALLTPHVSAVTDAFWERETALIVENLRRLREERPLRNVVDRGAGY